VIEPIVFYGIRIGWDVLLQYLSVCVLLGITIFDYYKTKSFKCTYQFSGLAIVLLLIGRGTRYLWIILENHLTGYFSLSENSFVSALDKVDQAERWYLAILVCSFLLLLIAKSNFKNRNNILVGFDIVIINISLCLAISKLGCFLSGHGCYGTITSMPWGCHFKNGQNPSLFKAHPTPLYDMFVHLCLYSYLKYKKYYLTNPGHSSFLLLAIISFYNILIEVIRTNPVVIYKITMVQIVYIPILIFSLQGLITNQKSKR